MNARQHLEIFVNQAEHSLPGSFYLRRQEGGCPLYPVVSQSPTPTAPTDKHRVWLCTRGEAGSGPSEFSLPLEFDIYSKIPSEVDIAKEFAEAVEKLREIMRRARV